jgi:hypothetical protein
VQNRYRIVSKDDLLEAIWGQDRLRIVLDQPVQCRVQGSRRQRRGAASDPDCTPHKGIRFVGGVLEEHEPPAPVDTRPVTVDPPRPALALADKPSIAVPPFADLSADPEQEYFADGMVGEIITALSRIRELFVVGCNSTFNYKRQAVNMKQVGRELGVR